MERTVVAKFGGSSLADWKQFEKVKSIIESDRSRRFVVPSAPGKRYGGDDKITDLLYRWHDEVGKGMDCRNTCQSVKNRYFEIIEGLCLNLDISKEFDTIERNITMGASSDYTASRGEYLNSIILSRYLGYDFIDASEVILFDSNGHFDDVRTQSRLKDELSKHKNAVIPGFYGSMPDGSIKTFSRGGSDVTGSIVTRGADACLYENWTDVSGFMIADPRIVKNPVTIKKVTYRELRELSYMGASVLHDEAIFPVREAGIPINIKNTNSPCDPGTMIVREYESGYVPGIITGIAGKKNFTVIAIEKTLMNSEVGFGRKLLSILENHSVSFEHMPTGIDTISLVIEDSQLNGSLHGILREIQEKCRPDSIQVFPNMALIATVGQGMAGAKGTAARLFTSLSKAGVDIRMIDQGSSGINIIVGIEADGFENAVKAIYVEFVGAQHI